MIVVKDVRPTLEIELGKRQRAAFHLGRAAAHQGLKIAFIGYPDAPEIAVDPLAIRRFQNGRQGLARQAPPLAAHVGHDPLGNLAADAKPPLQPDVAVEQPALVAPRKRKPQRETFRVQTTDCPANIGRCDAFDEIRSWPRIQKRAQIFSRAQRQA